MSTVEIILLAPTVITVIGYSIVVYAKLQGIEARLNWIERLILRLMNKYDSNNLDQTGD